MTTLRNLNLLKILILNNRPTGLLPSTLMLRANLQCKLRRRKLKRTRTLRLSIIDYWENHGVHTETLKKMQVQCGAVLSYAAVSAAFR